MPPKNGLQKIQPENPSRAQSKIQSADVAVLEASQYAHLRNKKDLEKPKILQLAILHLSAFQDIRDWSFSSFSAY